MAHSLMNLGDGVTDDTDGLRLMVLIAWVVGRKLYIPAGSYIVTDTIDVSVPVRQSLHSLSSLTLNRRFHQEVLLSESVGHRSLRKEL